MNGLPAAWLAVWPGDPALVGRVLVTGVLAFGLTVLFTGRLIGWLRARQLGKAIRVDGPDHAAKAGTPTMGGMGMLVVVALAGISLLGTQSPSPTTGAATAPHIPASAQVAIVCLSLLLFALLGAADDWAGLARKGNVRELGVGLTARQMIAAQVLAAGIVTYLLMASRTPVSGAGTSTGAWIGQAALFAAALVGTVNGVNMSDGLDGLASGLLAIAFATLAVLLGLLANGWETGTVAWSVGCVAACLGFLVYNRHPARVFMGNVTSMGLGAVLATLAIANGLVWWLPLVGLVFVAEVISVILQVSYFKATHGRRLFKMAPIHHHFERLGLAETAVVRRFWSAGAVAGGVAIIAAFAYHARF